MKKTDAIIILLFCLSFYGIGYLKGEKKAEIKAIHIEIQLRSLISTQAEALISALSEARFWKEHAEGLHKGIIQKKIRIVEVTAYSATKEQCDNDPDIAASMKPPRVGTIAVSRDLFDMGWTFGKKVYLKGIGSYEINDIMNKRFRHRVDIFIPSTKQAGSFEPITVEAILI